MVKFMRCYDWSHGPSDWIYQNIGTANKRMQADGADNRTTPFEDSERATQSAVVTVHSPGIDAFSQKDNPLEFELISRSVSQSVNIGLSLSPRCERYLRRGNVLSVILLDLRGFGRHRVVPMRSKTEIGEDDGQKETKGKKVWHVLSLRRAWD